MTEPSTDAPATPPTDPAAAPASGEAGAAAPASADAAPVTDGSDNELRHDYDKVWPFGQAAHGEHAGEAAPAEPTA